MTWSRENSQGREASKVRFDLVPYARGRALDIGCGEDKLFPSFVGVDNCKDNILFGAQIRPDVVIEDAADLSLFQSATFSCVFSSHTLEHIEDYRRALAEWWRLVRVGGTLALYLPHADLYPNIGQDGANPDHKHDFRNDEITAVMLELGGWDLLVDEVRDQGDEYSFLQVYRKRADGAATYPCRDPQPEKTVAFVRLGAFGDALWLSSVLPHFKAEGYHVTVYTQDAGEAMLRHDPNVDRIITQPEYLFRDVNLLAYWRHEEAKYDRFINLVGSIESRLLPTKKDAEFYWADEVRRRVMNANYLETVHRWCGVEDKPPRVRFYPTVDEHEQAKARRTEMRGPVVVFNPSGSGQYKWWPHWPAAARLLAEKRVHVVVLGDVPGDIPDDLDAEYIHVVAREWPIRDAIAFAQVSDVVIGAESAILNAVAFEPMLKVALLSHSTQENLTRDWPETVSFAVQGLDCYPCHRIHHDMSYCTQHAETLASACQASIRAEDVAQTVLEYLLWLREQAQEAA